MFLREPSGREASAFKLRKSAAQMSRLLDYSVRKAHSLRWGAYRIHPYFLMCDLAVGAELTLAWVWSLWVPDFHFGRFVVAFVCMQAFYQLVYLPLKLRLLGERARSFLQDTLLVILPTFLLVSRGLGQSMSASLDLAGLALPLGLAFIRLGCFFGGCCYGQACSWGVWYEPELLVPVEGWRRYTPGPFPGQRVLPIQLLEAAYAFFLFIGLMLRSLLQGGPDGYALPYFLVLYSLYRLTTDTWRGHRHRPKKGRLSEAQWTCLFVVTVAALLRLLRK